ncbi:hypothetical protein PARC_a0705 [Pseudoalteromonas arctica A 37-1-2]|uniref:Uncharacterized protein n=1 Tax=Pseudoalteromonas arctica A 37-1-2 TaxID=1117313 RepID=A0A290RZE3_9GAMM|nr:hypothetical protein PARC_a0705 [Pseudoalteromonas arctica A 37-1-2]
MKISQINLSLWGLVSLLQTGVKLCSVIYFCKPLNLTSAAKAVPTA